MEEVMDKDKLIKLINAFASATGSSFEQVRINLEMLFESFSKETIPKKIKYFDALGHFLTKEQRKQIRLFENKFWSGKLASDLYLKEEKKKRQKKLKVSLLLAFYNLSKR